MERVLQPLIKLPNLLVTGLASLKRLLNPNLNPMAVSPTDQHPEAVSSKTESGQRNLRLHLQRGVNDDQRPLLQYFLEQLSPSEEAMKVLTSFLLDVDGRIEFETDGISLGGYLPNYVSDNGVMERYGDEIILNLCQKIGNDLKLRSWEEILKSLVHELGHFADAPIEETMESYIDRMHGVRDEAVADAFLFRVACQLPQQARATLLEHRDLGNKYEYFLATHPAVAHMKNEPEKQEAFLSIFLPLQTIHMTQNSLGTSYRNSETDGLNVTIDSNPLSRQWGLDEIAHHPDGIPQPIAQHILFDGYSKILDAILEASPSDTMASSLNDEFRTLNSAAIGDGERVLPIPGDFMPGNLPDGEQIFYPVRRVNAGRTLAQIEFGMSRPELAPVFLALNALKRDYHDPHKVSDHMRAITEMTRLHHETIRRIPDLYTRVEALLGKTHPALSGKWVPAPWLYACLLNTYGRRRLQQQNLEE